MSWTLVAALLLASGAPPAADDPALVSAPAQEQGRPAWQLSMRVAAPMTTTDPRHVGPSVGVGRSGKYRAALRYQPSGSDLLGFVHGTFGFRLHASSRWTIAADVEHSRVWSARQLYRSGTFRFEGHDRRWLYLGVISARASHRRWLGVIDGFEAGAGRMVIREQVAGRVDGAPLNDDPILVLKTEAPVGMLGLTLTRTLPLGFAADARVRVIGAGRSRGGVVPFAHATVDWEVLRPIFNSPRFGRGQIGLTGNHSTSPRAATYYQNGVGVALKIAF